MNLLCWRMLDVAVLAQNGLLPFGDAGSAYNLTAPIANIKPSWKHGQLGKTLRARLHNCMAADFANVFDWSVDYFSHCVVWFKHFDDSNDFRAYRCI